MVFEAFEGAGGQGFGGSGALGGHVGQGGVVRFAIVHQDLVLAADAQVLAGLGGVRHRDEGDVVGC